MSLGGGLAIPLGSLFEVRFHPLPLGISRAHEILLLGVAAPGASKMSLEHLLRLHLGEELVAQFLRLAMVLHRRLGKPEVGFGQVRRHTPSGDMELRQGNLGVHLPELGGPAIPVGRHGKVVRHSLPVGKEHAKIVLGGAVILIGGFAKPLGRLHKIVRDANAPRAKNGKIELGRDVALVRGLAKPLDGGQQVLGNFFPGDIHQAEVELRQRVALLRGGPDFLKRPAARGTGGGFWGGRFGRHRERWRGVHGRRLGRSQTRTASHQAHPSHEQPAPSTNHRDKGLMHFHFGTGSGA